MTHGKLTQFQLDALNQIAQGPAVGVFILRSPHNDGYVLPLIETGLIIDVSEELLGKNGRGFWAVMMTATGVAFSRTSGSTQEN